MFTRLLMLLVSLLFPGGDAGPEPDTESTDDGDADNPPADPEPDDDSDDGDGDSVFDRLDSDTLQALRDELKGLRRDQDTDQNALRFKEEAVKYRLQAREAQREAKNLIEEQNKKILEALGVGGSEKEDPATEAERLRAENRTLKTRQFFSALARQNGADEDLTWGYLLASGELEGLDPNSDDFQETLQEKVTQALEAKPSLKTTPAPPPKGGADLDDDGNPDAVAPEEMSMDDFMKWRAERDKKD